MLIYGYPTHILFFRVSVVRMCDIKCNDLTNLLYQYKTLTISFLL